MHRFPPWWQTDETAGMSQTETKQVYVFTFRLEFPAGKEEEQQHASEASAEEPEESSESHTLETILLFFFLLKRRRSFFAEEEWYLAEGFQMVLDHSIWPLSFQRVQFRPKHTLHLSSSLCGSVLLEQDVLLIALFRNLCLMDTNVCFLPFCLRLDSLSWGPPLSSFF